MQLNTSMVLEIYDQGRRGAFRIGGGAKLDDFPIKFETFIFTNSKSPEIFRRSIEISENLTISKQLGG